MYYEVSKRSTLLDDENETRLMGCKIASNLVHIPPSPNQRPNGNIFSSAVLYMTKSCYCYGLVILIIFYRKISNLSPKYPVRERIMSRLDKCLWE